KSQALAGGRWGFRVGAGHETVVLALQEGMRGIGVRGEALFSSGEEVYLADGALPVLLGRGHLHEADPIPQHVHGTAEGLAVAVGPGADLHGLRLDAVGAVDAHRARGGALQRPGLSAVVIAYVIEAPVRAIGEVVGNPGVLRGAYRNGADRVRTISGSKSVA